MLKCKKATTITNKKGVSFAIDKQRGGYPSIYNDEQFLNLDIVQDLAAQFDEFFIDLTDIGAGSKTAPDKVQLIQSFEALLKGEKDAPNQLRAMINESTQQQYIQGL
jgi:putative protease